MSLKYCTGHNFKLRHADLNLFQLMNKRKCTARTSRERTAVVKREVAPGDCVVAMVMELASVCVFAMATTYWMAGR